MSSSGKLKADPLFVGLTRPPLFLGVSYMYFVLYMLGCMIYFINANDFKVFLLGAFIHFIGYMVCYKEPLFIELYRAKFSKCAFCRNKSIYGANSYDLF